MYCDSASLTCLVLTSLFFNYIFFFLIFSRTESQKKSGLISLAHVFILGAVCQMRGTSLKFRHECILHYSSTTNIHIWFIQRHISEETKLGLRKSHLWHTWVFFQSWGYILILTFPPISLHLIILYDNGMQSVPAFVLHYLWSTKPLRKASSSAELLFANVCFNPWGFCQILPL